MSLAGAPCNCGDSGLPTVIRYDDGTYPAVAGNVVTIAAPTSDPAWSATGGGGISIRHPAGDSTRGHSPTIALDVSPSSPVPLGFDSLGRLQAGPVPASPALLINGGNSTVAGIKVVHGGDLNHAPVLTVELSSSSPVPLSFDGTGKLKAGPVPISATDGLASVFLGADGGLAVDTGPELYVDHGNSGATETVDVSAGPVHRVVLDSATLTLTFTGATAGRAEWLTLIVVHDSTSNSRTVAWPATVKWSGGAPSLPDTTANAVSVFRFVTVDGGTTWFGLIKATNMA